MYEEFHKVQESLKDYLIDSGTDKYTSKHATYQKYNNLKLYMEPRKHPDPHFIVRIGISEAMYDLESCKRLTGGLGSDEKMIRRWFERSFNRDELKRAWNDSKKIKNVTLKKDDADF